MFKAKPGTRALLILALFHPLPSIATTAAAVAFALIFRLPPGDPRFWRLALTMLLAQFSISALNDWADRQRDTQARRPRPLAVGVLSPAAALAGAVACAALALALGAELGTLPNALVAVGLGAGWAYDLGLKSTPLSFLPFAVAFPLLPLWVAAVTGFPLGFPVLVLAVAGIPLATAIHLADAIPDRELDAAGRARTLAVALGGPKAELAVCLGLASGATILGLSLVPARPAVTLIVTAVGWSAAIFYLRLIRQSKRVDTRRRAKWIVVAGTLLVTAAWLASA